LHDFGHDDFAAALLAYVVGGSIFSDLFVLQVVLHQLMFRTAVAKRF